MFGEQSPPGTFLLPAEAYDAYIQTDEARLVEFGLTADPTIFSVE